MHLSPRRDTSSPPSSGLRPLGGIVIRDLHPGDAAATRSLAATCSVACLRDRFFGRRPDPGALLVHQLEEAVRDGGAVGAFFGEVMVAMALGVPDPPKTAWELGVLVRDDWQGRGIGGSLVRRLLEASQSAGVVPVAVVQAANWRAIRLLRRSSRTPAGRALRVEVC